MIGALTASARPYQGLQAKWSSTYILLTLAGLVTVSAVCSAVFGVGVLRILFPAATVVLGLILYLRSPTSYVAYTFIVWFVSPLVRRLIDLRAGWVDPSPVLLAPLLVTLISTLAFPSILRGEPKFRWPYLLAFTGVLYGLGVSFLRGGPAGVAVPLLNFVAPIFFGAYIVSNWRECRQLAETFDRTLIAGVLVMGVYGIAQYQFAPAWDTNWMINQHNVTFGTAEPFGIRVFSTLNSPLPFGDVMMAGLLILANRRGWAGKLVPFVGCLAFGLSLARTAWLGWATGMFGSRDVFQAGAEPIGIQHRVPVGCRRHFCVNESHHRCDQQADPELCGSRAGLQFLCSTHGIRAVRRRPTYRSFRSGYSESGLQHKR